MNLISVSHWEEKLKGAEYVPYFQDIANGDISISDRNLSKSVNEKLKAIAPTDKAQHMVLMSTLFAFVHKLTGKEDIVLFTPNYEDEHVFPVRLTMNGDMKFSEIVMAVQKEIASSLPHSGYALDQIITSEEISEGTLIGFSYYPLQQKVNSQSKFHSIFRVTQEGEDLKIDVSGKGVEVSKYLADLYWEFTMNVLSDPKREIGKVQLLSGEHQQMILDVFNNTEKAFREDTTVMHMFRENVESNPNHTAIRYNGKSMTYLELDEKSNQVANLISGNTSEQQVIGVRMGRSLELMVTIFGILKSGNIYLPMSLEYPEERTEYVLVNSASQLLFVENAEEKEEFGSLKCFTVEDAVSQEKSFELQCTPEERAYIIYTSGSTGKPKGAIIKHRSIINRLQWMQNEYPLSSEDIILQKTPLVFDVSIWELFWWSMFGAQLVLADRGVEKIPQELLNTINDEKVSVMHFVPSMLTAFVGHLNGNEENAALSSLKHVFASGEELKSPDAQRFLKQAGNARLHNLYGPTEATIDVSSYEVERGIEHNSIPIGKPIDNTQLYVVNAQLQLLPIGVPGELVIGGVNLAEGYLKRPELTAEKFVQNPLDENSRWYRTGDLARWLPDGNIEFLGRIDNQVKIRGNRVELGEIEHVMRQFEGVQNSVVLPKEGASGLQLVGYYRSTDNIDEDQLHTYLGSKLPEYMVPSYFIQVDEFKLTVNGKVDRKFLLGIERKTTLDFTMPETKMEQALLSIWQDVLEQEMISTNEHFFRIGGDSILAVRVLGSINEKLGANLTMVELYENDTIMALGQIIENADDSVREQLQDEVNAEIEQFEANYLALNANENIERVFPMSSIEKAMCFVHISRPDDVLYFEQIMQHVTYDRLDVVKLNQALQIMIGKHEILRTGFDFENFAHVIYKSVDQGIAFHDLSGLSFEEQKSIIHKNLGLAREKHFDLDEHPLWRIIVYKLSEAHHELLYEYHHAIFDGWSVASFTTELNNIYASLMREEEVESIPLSCSYEDFIKQEIVQQRDQSTRDFWINELKDYEKLSLDVYSEGKVFKSVHKEYPQNVFDGVHKAAADLNTNTKLILFTAYLYAMKILSGQKDILVGLITFTRPLQEDGDKILGCFLNEVPFRLVVEDDISWKELLNQVETKFLEVKKYDQLSLFEINQAIGAITTEGNPLFDSTFNFINWHVMNNLELQEATDTDVDVMDFESFLRGNTSFDANYNMNDERILCMHEYASPFMTESAYEQYEHVFLYALNQLAQASENTLPGFDTFWQSDAFKVQLETEPSNMSLFPDRVRFWKDRLNFEEDWKQARTNEVSQETSGEQIKIETNALHEVTRSYNIEIEDFMLGISLIIFHKNYQVKQLKTIACLNGKDETIVNSDFESSESPAEYFQKVSSVVEENKAKSDLPLKDILAHLKTNYGADDTLNFAFHWNGNTSSLNGNNLQVECNEEEKFVAITLSSKAGIDAELLNRMSGQFQTIINQLQKLSVQDLGSISLLSEEEKEEVLAFSGVKQTFEPREYLHSFFEESAVLYPNEIALEIGEQFMTYAEAENQSNAIANHLIENGVKQGDVVGLEMNRSCELITAMLGILKSGAAYLPIQSTLPEERKDFMINDASVKVLLTDVENHELEGSLAVVQVSDALNQANFASPSLAVREEDVAYIIYTSGSTGKPKGVEVLHKNAINLVYAQRETFKIDRSEKIMQFASISFDASVEQIWLALSTGARLVLVEEQLIPNIPEFVAYMEEKGITHLHATPSFLDRLEGPVASLKRIIAGGEECKPSLINKFVQKVPVYNEYGPTETTITATMATFRNEVAEPVSIGKPLANYSAFVLGQDYQLLPKGMVGELFIGGSGVAKGYLNREELTADSFIERPEISNQRLYATGDLVRWTTTGELIYLGRKDDQIKVRGYRIETGEIESVALSHPGIEHAVVSVKEFGEDVRLLLHYKGKETVSQDELKEYLVGKIPGYMVPDYCIPVQRMPLNANGKIDKKALPSPDFKSSASFVAAETEMEEKLVSIWAELLQLPVAEVGIENSFFELGGNSLLIIQLLGKMKSELGWEISVPQLFSTPTISALIQHMLGEGDTLEEDMEQMEEEVEEMDSMLSLFDQD